MTSRRGYALFVALLVVSFARGLLVPGRGLGFAWRGQRELGPLCDERSDKHVSRNRCGGLMRRRVGRGSMALGARKHLAVTYGNFLDALPRKKTKKITDLAEKLGIDERVQNAAPATGDEQRRERERNLKVVAKTQDPTPNLQAPPKRRKWSDEEVSVAIECLNRSYSRRSREELSEEQRVGVIDWSVFDLHAEELIADYASDEGGIKVRSKVMSWINYHRRKKDIRFEHDTWVWDPEGSDKRGRDKRKVAARGSAAAAKTTTTAKN